MGNKCVENDTVVTQLNIFTTFKGGNVNRKKLNKCLKPWFIKYTYSPTTDPNIHFYL